jgi:Na+-translocating ferredoxin:NAD+ oxidoreductase RnfA subunit
MSENKEIPQVFKGTPVLFLYISLLSLGFAAFSGNSIFS